MTPTILMAGMMFLALVTLVIGHIWIISAQKRGTKNEQTIEKTKEEKERRTT